MASPRGRISPVPIATSLAQRRVKIATSDVAAARSNCLRCPPSAVDRRCYRRQRRLPLLLCMQSPLLEPALPAMAAQQPEYSCVPASLTPFKLRLCDPICRIAESLGKTGFGAIRSCRLAARSGADLSLQSPHRSPVPGRRSSSGDSDVR
ncbi:hypothetical protein EMIT053CA3_250018 [Pseudomonas donghuensis]